MRRTRKAILSALLAIAVMVGLALGCSAETQTGTITVTLEDAYKNRIDGITVSVCCVAELNQVGYYPTSAFEGSGISISGIINNPDETTARTLADYVRDNHIEWQSKVTENGRVSFTDLNFGIWLVYGEEDATYTFNPFIAFVPYESAGQLYYEVSSTPKVENGDPNATSVYVLKKWDDKNNAAKKRPDTITVELLDGGAVVASVTLSEANGWSHTFAGVPKAGTYTVREKTVTDYKASYGGDAANGFIITNTYAGEKLPQTGQYWWPILVMAVAGAAFVLLGIYELGVKRHGKKG